MRQQVIHIATALLNQLDVVGIFGIELFLTADGRVLINEIAPRTHNSGHYTLGRLRHLSIWTTASGSQWIVTGIDRAKMLPGADDQSSWVRKFYFRTTENSVRPWQRYPMLTSIGMARGDACPGRKLGHVTVTCDRIHTRDELNQLIHQVEALWYPMNQGWVVNSEWWMVGVVWCSSIRDKPFSLHNSRLTTSRFYPSIWNSDWGEEKPLNHPYRSNPCRFYQDS